MKANPTHPAVQKSVAQDASATQTTLPSTAALDAATRAWPNSPAVAFTPLPVDGGGVAGGRGAPATSLLNAAKLTIPQAAKRIGIGETKMRAVIRRGEIPVLRIGGRTVIIEQDIEIYLRGNYGRMVVAERKPSGRQSLPKSIQESAMLKKAS